MAQPSLELVERFNAAASYLGFHGGRPHPLAIDAISLSVGMLYALYQQATVGSCNVPEPPAWDPLARRHWVIWHNHRNMDSKKAMERFLQFLEEHHRWWSSRVSNFSVEPVSDAQMNENSEVDTATVSDSKDNNVVIEGLGSIVSNQWISPPVFGQRPIARYEHGAAVVKDRMYIVGGNHNGHYLSDVHVLDLRSWTWSIIDANTSFIPCAGHKLVPWGNRLLSIGGHKEDSRGTIQVWALDMETYTWSTIQTDGKAPVSRRGQSVTILYESAVIFGGRNPNGTISNDLSILHLKYMTWKTCTRTLGVPPSPRFGHTAVADDCFLLIFGGRSDDIYFSDLHILDLKTMRWLKLAQQGMVPSPRAGHGAVAVGQNWFIIGGFNDKGEVSETVVLNMSTLVWSAVTAVQGSVDVAGLGLSLVAISRNGEDILISFGGYNGSYNNEVNVLVPSHKSTLLANTEAYVPDSDKTNSEVETVTGNRNSNPDGTELKTKNDDIVAEGLGSFAYDHWISPPVSGQRPSARHEHGAAVVKDKMYVVGGNSDGRYLSDVHALDLRSWAWSTIEANASMPLGESSVPGANHSLISWGNTLLSVVGHSDGASETIQVWALDLETHTWSTLQTFGKAPVSREGHSVTLLCYSDVVIFGGQDAHGNLLNDVHVLDLCSMTWDDDIRINGLSPSPRFGHIAAAFADEACLFIFGGSSGFYLLNDLHILDFVQNEWLEFKQEGIKPSPRVGHAGVTMGKNWFIVGGLDDKGEVTEAVVLDMYTLLWSAITTTEGSVHVASHGLSLVVISHGGEDLYHLEVITDVITMRSMLQGKMIPVWAFGMSNEPNSHGDTFEATNVASGTSEHSRVFIYDGVVPLLQRLVQCDGEDVWEHVRPALPSLIKQLVGLNDEGFLRDACHALSYLSDGVTENVQSVVEVGVCPRLVEILRHPSPMVVIPALHAVGSIVRGDDEQTQVIDAGALPCLYQLLVQSREKNVMKEACWTVSNITAGNMSQIQAVIEAGLISPLVNLFRHAEFNIKKEAACAISNATSRGSHEQIKILVSLGCIKPLCDLLLCPDPRIILACLEGLDNILKVGEAEKDLHSNGDVNHFAAMVDLFKGLNKIETLQTHDNCPIYEKAVRIFDKYFSCDESG